MFMDEISNKKMDIQHEYPLRCLLFISSYNKILAILSELHTLKIPPPMPQYPLELYALNLANESNSPGPY